MCMPGACIPNEDVYTNTSCGIVMYEMYLHKLRTSSFCFILLTGANSGNFSLLTSVERIPASMKRAHLKSLASKGGESGSHRLSALHGRRSPRLSAANTGA